MKHKDTKPEPVEPVEPAGDVADKFETPEQVAAKSEEAAATGVTSAPAGNQFRRLGIAYWQRKRWAIPLTVIGLVGLLLAVPATRYTLLGTFMERSFVVTVNDAGTGKPVTSADILLGGRRARTDNKGQASITSKVGHRQLSVSKRYYKSASAGVLVGVSLCFTLVVL